MKHTNITAILFFGLGMMLSPVSTVYGAQYLTVNGEDVEAVTLEAGKSYSVEVVSTDGASYTAYVGFNSGVVTGDFVHVETKAEAGNFAVVADFNELLFHGFYVNAAGVSPSPSAGIHFVFQYQPEQIGETYFKLYDQTFNVIIDFVQVTRIPAKMGTHFTYQGRLMEDNEAADGLYDFQFSLFNLQSGGEQLGTAVDINDLDVVDGQFAATLDFGDGIFDGNAVWLETTVAHGDGSDPNVLTPRVELTATPYALYAASGPGVSVPIPLELTDSITEPIISGTNTGAGIAVYGRCTSTTGTGSAIQGESDSLARNVWAVRGVITSTTPGSSSAAVRGINNGQGDAGIGVWGTHDGNGHGVYGTANGDTGRGVYGRAGGEHAFGIRGRASGSEGTGVFGEASNSGNTVNYGGYFRASGVEGRGVHAEASGADGRDVYGEATSSGDSINYGGYFKAGGTWGQGVHGEGPAYGGNFIARNDEGHGIHSKATGKGGTGVYGEASDSGDDRNYGGYFLARGQKGVGIYSEATATGAPGGGGPDHLPIAGEFYAWGIWDSVGIGVYSRGGLLDFYAAGAKTNFAPFTGSHEVKLSNGFPVDVEPGMIVSVTGEAQARSDEEGRVSISSTLPTVKLSDVANDKAVFGVFIEETPLIRDHWYQAQETERFANVNALGEGRVWVCNIDGEIETGDYITTSSVPGYGQKQYDNLLRSCTLGKAIETPDWDSVSESIEFEGQSYKRFLIAVVYTSG